MRIQNPETTPRRVCHWRRVALAGAALLTAGALGACGTDAGGDDDDRSRLGNYTAELASFDSCAQLEDYVIDLATDTLAREAAYGGYGYAEAGGDRGAPTNDTAGGELDAGGGGGETPDEFTTTNVQEEGVDEPDLMKTDGASMFVFRNGTLHILDAWPAEDARELARVEIGGYGEQMFLVDDRIVTFTNVWQERYDDGRERPEPMPDDEGGTDTGAPDEDGSEEPVVPTEPFAGTLVTTIDVSDPSAPEIVQSFAFEGSFTNARLIDGQVYIVGNSWIDVWELGLYEALEGLDDPGWDWSGEITLEDLEAREAEVRRLVRPLIEDVVREAGASALIPDIRTADGEVRDLFRCDEVMRPAAASGFGMLDVIAFDPATGAAPTGVGLFAQGWQVYASTEALYVAQDSRWWFWYDPTERVARTHIHKFVLGDGKPGYGGSGEVDGWLLNQFSMSEYEGFLRVATTDQAFWGWGVPVGEAVGGGTAEVSDGTVVEGSTGGTGAEPAPDSSDSSSGGDDDEPSSGSMDKRIVSLDDSGEDANNVFVLQDTGDALEIVGGITGIAPGEQIFAARFMGDTGYIVTFEQTDPLFVVDLSSPDEPELRGELHIPGFSTYLHPIGDGLLIGIGRDGDDDGRIFGVQLSLFDVTNPDDPQRIHSAVVTDREDSYSWSEAAHDHHAFTWYGSRDLLAIPVTTESWGDDGYDHFSGIVLYRVTRDGIEPAGRVSHAPMAHDAWCDRIGAEDEDCGWDEGWWTWMRRSAFFDDVVFAISDVGVTASPIDDPDTILSEVRF